jgi:hypothetical protein
MFPDRHLDQANFCRVEKQRIEAARDARRANTCTPDIEADFWMAHKPSYPSPSRRAAVNSDTVPKDLDRIIDAALDRDAEVLWEDAGHRAPMQVTADRVEKLHGRELRIVEADKAALAPDRQHAGKVRIGAVGSELEESPRKFREADALGDDQPVKTDCVRSHYDLHVAPRDVSESMADVGVNDLGIAERGNDALDTFLHDRGEQPVLAAEKRVHGGLGCPGALDDEIDGGAAVAVLQKDFDGSVQNLGASDLTARSGPPHPRSRRHGWPLRFFKRNVHYVIIGGRDVKSTSCVGNMPRPARN